MRIRQLLTLMGLACVSGAAAPAHAGLMLFYTDAGMNGKIDHDLAPAFGAMDTGRATPTSSMAGYNSFIASLGPDADIGVEDFELKDRGVASGFSGVDPFGLSGIALSLDLRFDRIAPEMGSLPITATLDGVGRIGKLADPINRSGRYPVSLPVGGDQYFDTNFEQLAFAVEFSDPVQGLGFFATDLGDFAGQIVLELTYEGGAMESLLVPHELLPVSGIANMFNASLAFFGFTSDIPISKVQFENQGGSLDRFGFDNLVVVTSSTTTPVPEPTSMALLGSGVFCLGLRYRRNRRKAGVAQS
jgi:hypothetical protein